jgi:hypothetical protein
VSNTTNSVSPAIAISGFELDLVSCVPPSNRADLLARLQVRIGPQTYPVVITARGFCMMPEGPRDKALEQAIRAEARKVVIMSLQEAVKRGGNARTILKRLEHASMVDAPRPVQPVQRSEARA